MYRHSYRQREVADHPVIVRARTVRPIFESTSVRCYELCLSDHSVFTGPAILSLKSNLPLRSYQTNFMDKLEKQVRKKVCGGPVSERA